jgi:hypothetical protein
MLLFLSWPQRLLELALSVLEYGGPPPEWPPK